MYKGIDVSQYQGQINWEAVKACGIELAIIRVGVGSDEVAQDDTCAVRNMTECERLGIPYGVYLYSYALTAENVKSEVQHTLRMIQGRKVSLGVWYDMEDSDGYKQQHGLAPENNKDLFIDFCYSFMCQIRDAGYQAGLYANKYYLTEVLAHPKLKEFNTWVAQWYDECTYTDPYIMWQYTSNGSVDGIDGRVDMNYYYGTLPEQETPQDPPKEPEEHQPPEESDTCEKVYTVAAGDTLSEIAAAYGTTYQVLAELNHIENPNLIYPAQTIRIQVECGSEDSRPNGGTDICAGKKVKVKQNACDVNGTQLADFVYGNTYDVIEDGGQEAVIGVSGTVTARMNKSDLYLA